MSESEAPEPRTAPVQLHRVGVDHLTVEPLGYLYGEIRLAGGRRTDHRDRLIRGTRIILATPRYRFAQTGVAP
jgi:hypothetical protein